MSEQLKPIKLACMQAGRHSNVKLLECYPTSVDEADCGRIAGERSVSEGINDEHRQLIVAAVEESGFGDCVDSRHPQLTVERSAQRAIMKNANTQRMQPAEFSHKPQQRNITVRRDCGGFELLAHIKGQLLARPAQKRANDPNIKAKAEVVADAGCKS